MRIVRLETKISEDTRKKLNYLGYIYSLKYDNHILEKIINDTYKREKRKEKKEDGMDI